MNTDTAVGALHGAGLTDVRMMCVAHSNFRRELALSLPAIRAVTIGNTVRAEVIAEHIELWLGFVHHHHTIEDELLWERLVERVPDALAPMIDLMEAQHQTVAELLDGCPTLTTAWRASASAADGDRLYQHLNTLVVALYEHLDAEETRVLPLMALHITQQEWDEFAERGMDSIPKNMLLTGFGMMLYEGDPEALAIEIGKLPTPLRPFLPFLAKRAFRRYAKRVHGTPTPARSARTPS